VAFYAPPLIPLLPVFHVLCTAIIATGEHAIVHFALHEFCSSLHHFTGETVTSGDPNEMSGLLGYGSSQWTSVGISLAYGISFENVPTASASAAQVIATDHLDATLLDMTTLNLRAVSFGDSTVAPTVESSPPVGTKVFNALVDLRPTKNLLVRV